MGIRTERSEDRVVGTHCEAGVSPSCEAGVPPTYRLHPLQSQYWPLKSPSLFALGWPYIYPMFVFLDMRIWR